MLQAVEGVTLTVLVENYVDMLLPDSDTVTRAGLCQHFDPKRGPVLAENGIAFLIEVRQGASTYRLLFDTGFTSTVILHNMACLGIEPASIDHIVISHGHPDHCGGMPGLLQRIGHPVPVSIHPDAFWPRYLRLRDGQVMPYLNFMLDARAWESAGARLVMNEGPLEVGPGILATGFISRDVPFEPPKAIGDEGGALYRIFHGRAEPDCVPDDQAVAIHIKDRGLVVLTGCAHAGIVNSIHAAQRATGVDRIYAVFGGFHLGFPGVPEENTEQTIAALKEMKPRILSPMHCTGFKAIAAISRAMPDVFLLQSAGTRIRL